MNGPTLKELQITCSVTSGIEKVLHHEMEVVGGPEGPTDGFLVIHDVGGFMG